MNQKSFDDVPDETKTDKIRLFIKITGYKEERSHRKKHVGFKFNLKNKYIRQKQKENPIDSLFLCG